MSKTQDSLAFETRVISENESSSLFADWIGADALVLTHINESTSEEAGSMTVIRMTSEEANKLVNFVFFCLMREKKKEIRKKG